MSNASGGTQSGTNDPNRDRQPGSQAGSQEQKGNQQSGNQQPGQHGSNADRDRTSDPAKKAGQQSNDK